MAHPRTDDSRDTMSTDGQHEDDYEPGDTVYLKRELKAIREEQRTEARRLDDLNTYWSSQADALEKIIAECRECAEEQNRQLEELLNPPPVRRAAPGPSCLRFVDEDIFTLVACLVILANIVTMVLEYMDDHYREEFFWPDQLFMVFYVMELLLKAIYFQKSLLCGPCGDVWWHWMDLVIVVTGVFDMWIMRPILGGGNASSASCLSYLRALRLARLAKLLGYVYVFLMSDMSWTDGERFQSFIMGVIAFNAILIGLEADLPDFFLWFYVEHVLLCIFVFELFARIKRAKLMFFCQDYVWNYLDFIIVAGGIVDQWAMPAMALIQRLNGKESRKSGNLGHFMVMLRMARLLRILRLVRLVKNIEPLYTLIDGIVKAMQGMGWVMVLTITVLYVCAILGVKLVGHGLVIGSDAPEEVYDTFPTIPDSMFNLFMVMNADLSSMEDLLNYLPQAKYALMFYVVLTNWAIFSILTAVVGDNMTQASEELQEENARQQAEEHELASAQQLDQIFSELDKDKSDTIEKKDFDELLANELRSKELCHAAGLSPQELQDLFVILSDEGPGGEPVIHKEAFVEGLQSDRAEVSEREMMRLVKRVSSLETWFNDRMSSVMEALRKAISPLEPD